MERAGGSALRGAVAGGGRRSARSFGALLPLGAVGDDADVETGQLAHHAREQRAAEDLAPPRLVRRADEDVGRTALGCDAANGVDQVASVDLEEVDPEDAGQPPQRGELRRFFLARL